MRPLVSMHLSPRRMHVMGRNALPLRRRAYDDGAQSAPSLARQQLAKQVFLVLLRM